MGKKGGRGGGVESTVVPSSRFRDTSDLVFRGHFVSLNIAAKVCYDEQQFAMDASKHRRSQNEAVDVNHQADPYRET